MNYLHKRTPTQTEEIRKFREVREAALEDEIREKVREMSDETLAELALSWGYSGTLGHVIDALGDRLRANALPKDVRAAQAALAVEKEHVATLNEKVAKLEVELAAEKKTITELQDTIRVLGRRAPKIESVAPPKHEWAPRVLAYMKRLGIIVAAPFDGARMPPTTPPPAQSVHHTTTPEFLARWLALARPCKHAYPVRDCAICEEIVYLMERQRS